jgi:inner membrane protein
MIAPTHMVVGQFAYFCASVLGAHKPHVAEALFAAAAALLPDIDKHDGMVGRWLPWLSGPVEYLFGHRTITHSLVATFGVALLAWPLPEGYWLALVSGVASHALADMMTPAGVGWLWPSRVRCILPGNERYRFEAMGIGELWFAIVIGVLTIPVAAVAQHGAGPLGTVRDMMGWFIDARTYYDAHKSEADWMLDVTGQDNRAFRPLKGRFPVIGPWHDKGLILDSPAGPVTICREGSCDWYPERAILVRGADEQTTTRLFKCKTTSTTALLSVLATLEQAGNVYVTGRLRAKVPASLPTVAATGDGIREVTLNYARPEDFRTWPATAIFDIDLTVQVRHTPDAAVPFVALKEEAAGLSDKLSPHLP